MNGRRLNTGSADRQLRPTRSTGGPWGFGRELPIVQGQGSIDNEYLFVWLVQGYMGAVTFLLLLFDGTLVFFNFGIKGESRRDRELGFALLGILLGLAFTLTTVWLGAQSFEISFLLLGLSQVIKPENVAQFSRTWATLSQRCRLLRFFASTLERSGARASGSALCSLDSIIPEGQQPLMVNIRKVK